MATYTVMVWGKQHEVSVDRRSKSVFVASGEYKGETFSVQDRSEGAAVKLWKDAAKDRGN